MVRWNADLSAQVLPDQLPPILSAVRPPRICVSCSSVKGTFPPPRSRGISMKRGLVRVAISRARALRSLIDFQ